MTKRRPAAQSHVDIHRAKHRLQEENRTNQHGRILKITMGKTPPPYCLKVGVNGGVCASIDPVPKATHCAPCNDHFDNDYMDQSFIWTLRAKRARE